MKDDIVDIPPTMVKFFGGEGKMVRPSTEAVAALVRKIPRGKVTTLQQIRDALASEHRVKSACPAATTQSLIAAALEKPRLCYWRVLKKNGELIEKLPGSIEHQASQLEKEGFVVDYAKKPKVTGFKSKLTQFV